MIPVIWDSGRIERDFMISAVGQMLQKWGFEIEEIKEVKKQRYISSGVAGMDDCDLSFSESLNS